MSISKIGASIIGGISNLSPVRYVGKKFKANKETALGIATVSSIILKDGVGCYMYVKQSLNNKKIPDEKRKFVAALDLTNGLLMILAQIGMYAAMRKYSGPIFEKLFKKSFGELSRNNTISRVRRIASKAGETVYKKLKIGKDFDKVKKDSLELFKFIADIAAATIIGKRVIVPLIATPAAKKVEKWMNKEEEDKNNLANPSMQGTDKEAKNSTPVKQADDEETNLLEKFKKTNA